MTQDKEVERLAIERELELFALALGDEEIYTAVQSAWITIRKYILASALTDYGNARALAVLEEVEKGIPLRNEATKDSIAYANGFNVCRVNLLTHIENMKKEIKNETL
jgi:hypothetical protein